MVLLFIGIACLIPAWVLLAAGEDNVAVPLIAVGSTCTLAVNLIGPWRRNG